MKRYTIRDLQKDFPNDEACLEWLVTYFFPKGIPCKNCNKITKHHRVKSRPSYSCDICGHHVHPTANTIFHKSSTPLTLWFYAMFLISNTRSGISAKQLQRELGVTYKTAWRMFKQIRILMAESGKTLLEGDVEVDETFVGGKGVNRRNEWRDGYTKPKQVFLGMAQRGGKVFVKHVPNTGKWTLLSQIKENISPKARIHTDEFASYKNIHKYGYLHEAVNHGSLEYVRGDIYTQNIENVWSHFKRGITGVYRIVSKKYLQAYAHEYSFRYNHRRDKTHMFDLLLAQVAVTQKIS